MNPMYNDWVSTELHSSTPNIPFSKYIYCTKDVANSEVHEDFNQSLPSSEFPKFMYLVFSQESISLSDSTLWTKLSAKWT